MDEDFKEYLNGVFGNNIPDMFLEILQDAEECYNNIDSNEKNIFTLIRIFSANFSPEHIEKWEVMTNEDIESVKSANRAFFTAMYLELQEAEHLSIEEKLEIANFFLKTIDGMTLRVNGDIFPNQDAFINRIKKDIKTLNKEKKKWSEYIRIAAPIDDESVSHNQFKLSEKWIYDLSKLHELSEELHDAGFTDSKVSFKNAFDSNNTSKCNWTKPRTTLLYLLWLLFDKTTDKPSASTINLCCDLFTVNGKITARKTAQSTRIEATLTKSKKDLSGMFATIHEICNGIGFQ